MINIFLTKIFHASIYSPLIWAYPRWFITFIYSCIYWLVREKEKLKQIFLENTHKNYLSSTNTGYRASAVVVPTTKLRRWWAENSSQVRWQSDAANF